LNQKYKASVIICVFNEGSAILKALKSLRANDIYNEIETIIIDDCSTDLSTIEILKRIEKFCLIRVLRSKTNLGLSHSRNIGFKNSSSNIIIPLDADDELPPKTLDRIYKSFANDKSVDFIIGDYYLNNLDTNEINLIECQEITSNNIIDAKKLSSNWKLLGTSPCKKETWQKVGGYNLEYSYSVQDVDFWIRVIQKGCKGIYLNTPIYKWNKSSNGMNSSFDTIVLIQLLEKHTDFYLLSQSKKEVYNKIFESHYPNKRYNVINNLTKRYFLKLGWLNKLRSIYILIISNFGKA